MQQDFLVNEKLMAAFVSSMSMERFATYKRLACNDDLHAIKLYKWNSELSQSLWASVQAWEICLRNKLNNFLRWKFVPSWHYDEQRAIRQLRLNERRKLQDARERQEQSRSTKSASLGAVVADLSPGFWVSLLGPSYNIPFVWRTNLKRVFPINPQIERKEAWEMCNGLLDLRNRIAHHEPILKLPLDARHAALAKMVSAMCPGTAAYVRASCGFQSVWTNRPEISN